MFTSGGSRLVLPVEVLLGQKTRKQLGARGDGHSSCHCSLARQRGLWGSGASSPVNNTNRPESQMFLERLRSYTRTSFSCICLGMMSELEASASILGCFMSADLYKCDLHTFISGKKQFCKVFKLL